jgi:hypothetical protein
VDNYEGLCSFNGSEHGRGTPCSKKVEPFRPAKMETFDRQGQSNSDSISDSYLLLKKIPDKAYG